jgi:TPR repeat protein
VVAVRWLRLAADQGDITAQHNLGVMYANGAGVPSDLIFAYMWWSLAASKGNEGARTNSNVIAERMTREQISEAQRRALEWIQAQPSASGN